MNFIKPHKLQAFTLIETILYLALFNVIFISVIGFTISLTQNNRMSEYRNAMDKNAIFVTEHLQDTFSKANTIDNANSTYNQDNGKIRLTLSSGYLEYYIQDSTIKVTNGTTVSNLTDNFVAPTRFYIESVVNAQGVQSGARITIFLVARKYPNITKTVSTYYDFR